MLGKKSKEERVPKLNVSFSEISKIEVTATFKGNQAAVIQNMLVMILEDPPKLRHLLDLTDEASLHSTAKIISDMQLEIIDKIGAEIPEGAKAKYNMKTGERIDDECR